MKSRQETSVESCELWDSRSGLALQEVNTDERETPKQNSAISRKNELNPKEDFSARAPTRRAGAGAVPCPGEKLCWFFQRADAKGKKGSTEQI
jgi:hypothetical protein